MKLKLRVGKPRQTIIFVPFSRTDLIRKLQPPSNLVDSEKLLLVERDQANEQLANELRVSLKKREKEYNQAIKKSRPMLDTKKEMLNYSSKALAQGKVLAEYILEVMVVQTSLSYAETAISQDIVPDGVQIEKGDVMNMARRMFRIKTLKLLTGHFGLTEKESAQIMYNTINREFPLSPRGSNQGQAPAPNSNDFLKDMFADAFSAGGGERSAKQEEKTPTSERKRW